MIVSTEVFIKSFSNLNTVEVGSLLSNDEYYLNVQKSTFIVYLTKCFNSFRRLGDTEFSVNPGRCTFPTINVTSYTFIGNKTKNYLEVNVHEQEGNFSGITECYCFSTESVDGVDGRRFYIDPKRGSTF